MAQSFKNSGRVILLLLVCVAAAEFLLRGSLRAPKGCDLASPYVSALRLRHRENPFSSKNFLRDWHNAGAPQRLSVDPSGQHPIYPPTAIIALAPLAALRWPTAVLLYGWICSATYILLVWLLSNQVGDSIRSLRRLGFIAFALGISSMHAGLAQANPSAIVLVLSGFALALSYFRDNPISGALLALGFCIKPTSAIAAALILLLYRRFKSFATFVGVSMLIAIASLIAMYHVPSNWKSDYQDNLRFLFGHNGAADFASSYASRYDLVNLQVPVYAMFHSIHLADVLAVGAAAVLAAIWLYLYRKEGDSCTGSYWLATGTLSLIALLPVYQRNYNAAVILFLAVWLFQNIGKIHARLALIAAVPFLFPGEAILVNLSIEQRFENNVFWNALVMPHLTWSILAVILVCLLYKYRNPTSVSHSAGS